VSASTDKWVDWANLIRAEYSEIPGLSLSLPQVERLWNLDAGAAKLLVGHLVSCGFLHCTPRGIYVRADLARS
jgi:hypothetical protein